MVKRPFWCHQIGATSVREWLPTGATFPNPPTLDSRVSGEPIDRPNNMNNLDRTIPEIILSILSPA